MGPLLQSVLVSTHSQIWYVLYAFVAIFRSTFSSWPNKVGLKCPSVRPSVPKSFFDFNEMWCVGRGRWVMHDGLQYDPIQGQGHGHEPLKVGNSAIFKGSLLPHLQWELANDHAFLNQGTIPKAYQGRIFDIWPSFCVMWLWIGSNVTCEESTVSPVRG